TGVFAELFSLGYGKLAATQLPPSERLPYLVRLLESPAEVRRRLALRAFDEALDTHMARTDIGDVHGLRRLPDRWMPKTYGELWSAYRDHFEALYSHIPHLPEKAAQEAVAIVLRRARSLIQMKPLADPMPAVIAALVASNREEKTPLLTTVVRFL